MANYLGNTLFLRLYPAISASLLALSLEEFPYAWGFALIGIVPLLWGIFKEENFRRVFLKSWLAGFLFYSLSIRWFLAAYPPDWAGVYDEEAALFLVLFVWLGSAAVLGLSFGLFGFFTRIFANRTLKDFLLIPFLWIVFQYAASWLFVFWSYGPGSSFGPYWTLGNPAYAFVDSPFVYWSRLAGLYGVSFAIASVNVVLFEFARRRGTKKLFPVAGPVLVLLLLPWFFYWLPLKKVKTEQAPLRFAVVQTDLRVPFYQKGLMELYGGGPEKKQDQPDIVVFPEDSHFFTFMGDAEGELLAAFFPDKERAGLIVTSATFRVPEGGRKKFVYYRDAEGNLVSSQEKAFLIPTGEFMPSLLKILVLAAGKPYIDDVFSGERLIIKGRTAPEPVIFGKTRLGTILCSGVIAPSLYNSLAKQGAEVLINPASQGIFKGNRYFLRQVKMMARFQAVSNEKPFVQASQGGLSYVIGPEGNVIAENIHLGNKILTATVKPVPYKNLYVRFGDWLVFLAVLFLSYEWALFAKRGFKPAAPFVRRPPNP